MLRKIASASTLLSTVCLTTAVFAQSVQSSPERVRVVRQAESSPSAALTVAAYHAPRSTASHSKVDEESNDYDVIIKNGRIIDGAGNPWVSGDLAIRGARIVKIGKLEGARAKRVIDARGLVVSPGFIDMLGQSEMALLIDNRAISKLSQGITTEITGEGASIAPQDALTLAQLQPDLDRYHLKVDWTTLEGYFTRLENNGTPLNIGTYVGAAQVREAILGDVDRAPTPDELEKMKALVAQAMQDGAFGLSTALIYPPGHYAKTDELIELAKVAAQYGGIYGTHMRSEGQTEKDAIEEALRIGREAGLPVEIFHLKVSGKTRWGSMPKIVAMIQAARDSGQDVLRAERRWLPACLRGWRTAACRNCLNGCKIRSRVPRLKGRWPPSSANGRTCILPAVVPEECWFPVLKILISRNLTARRSHKSRPSRRKIHSTR